MEETAAKSAIEKAELPASPAPASFARVRRSVWKRTLVYSIGWGFILLGIVGLFLPILQGLLFLMIGCGVLSTEYAWAHHLLARMRKRFPHLDRQFEKMKARLVRYWS